MKAVTALVVALLAGMVCAGALATFPGAKGKIAFRRYFNDEHTKSGIFIINPNGTGEQQITSSPAGIVDDQPDWSPDGKQIVFGRCPTNGGSCSIWLMNSDGSNQRTLSPECVFTQNCEDDSMVSFLPDGKHVVFTRAWGTVKEGFIEHSALVVSDLSGQDRQTVVQSTPFQGDYNFAAYSPDGKRLVYERHNSGFSSPQFKSALFVVDVATGAQRQITSWDMDAGDNPDWSPDGKWIVFRTHVNTDEGCQIDIIHPDGTGLTQLTHFTNPHANVRSAAFSPDGTQIAFGTDNGLGTNPDVYAMNVDGSDLHAIETNPLWDSAADWGSLQ
jgi:TolB protein